MDDLELRRLEAVAVAVPAALDLLFAEGYGADGRVVGLSEALDILEGRNISNEDVEYDDGPWVTGGTDVSTGAEGHWHFPGPDVKDEVKPPIQIEPLKQGFEVILDHWGHLRPDKLAFTDRVDVAEWLLGWLGFEDEIVESVQDILAGLWDADELYRTDGGPCTWFGPGSVWMERDHERALDVARAALAYVEAGELDVAGEVLVYQELVEAVEKWRAVDHSNLPFWEVGRKGYGTS